MKTVLGISVSARTVRAVCLNGTTVQWYGCSEYDGADDLSQVLSELALQCPNKPSLTRVVLERDVVQLRSISPAPPIRRAQLLQYLKLESTRLFRTNCSPNVVDGKIVSSQNVGSALWAAAAPSNIVCAVIEGCKIGRLPLSALGSAAEVLPMSLAESVANGEVAFPNGSGCELISIKDGKVWRSRRIRDRDWEKPELHPQLREMCDEASNYAAAFGAALANPTLQLLPDETRRARSRKRRRRVWQVLFAAAMVWIVVGALYTGRLVSATKSAERELRQVGTLVDSALTIRRNFLAVKEAIQTVEHSEYARSRTLELLASITNTLGDSAFLRSVRLSPDASLRLSGYANSAASVLAELEEITSLSDLRFDAPVVRETVGFGGDRRDWDRFEIVARITGGEAR